MESQNTRPVYSGTPSIESLIGPVPGKRKSADDAISKESATQFVNALEVGRIVHETFPVEFNMLLIATIKNTVAKAALTTVKEILTEQGISPHEEAEPTIVNTVMKMTDAICDSIEASCVVEIGHRMNEAITDFLVRIGRVPEGRRMLRTVDGDTPRIFSEEIQEEYQRVIKEMISEDRMEDFFHDPAHLVALENTLANVSQ